ncbi:MAG: ribonuclease P protein component [Aestuariivirga sp.]
MERLKRRQDFIAAAKARSCAMSSMVVQARKRAEGETVRVGFTVTKKLGNAVVRNRIKRRLREVARLGLEQIAEPGYDYVLIGRGSAKRKLFAELRADLASALKRLHSAPHEASRKDT